MNYVELHLGDWAQAVAHLSMVEEASYLRLLRRYYGDEKPLPADVAACQRLAGARTQEERDAVAVVLSEFFVLTADGHRHRRAEAEIAKANAKKDKAAASARARWDTGAKHPESDTDASEVRTDSEADATAMRPQCDRNAHQTPDTRHQKEQEHSVASLHPSPADADESPAAKPDPVVQVVIDAYHRNLPNCQAVLTLTPKRRRLILAANKIAKSLIAQRSLGVNTAEFWDRYFAECSEDPWLRGDVPDPRSPSWKQNLEVLLRDKHFGDVMDRALARDLGRPA